FLLLSREFTLILDLHSLPTRRSSDLLARGVALSAGGRDWRWRNGHRAAAVGSDDLRHLCPPERLVYRSFWLAARTCFPWDALLRSEEHTSELQSRFDLVCRLLL